MQHDKEMLRESCEAFVQKSPKAHKVRNGSARLDNVDRFKFNARPSYWATAGGVKCIHDKTHWTNTLVPSVTNV